MSALQNKQKTRKNILPFVTEYRPSVPINLKTIQMSKRHLIENQPLLREIYKDPFILSYRRREIFERRTRKSKLALKVIFFLSRPIGAVFGLSSLFYHHCDPFRQYKRIAALSKRIHYHVTANDCNGLHLTWRSKSIYI